MSVAKVLSMPVLAYHRGKMNEQQGVKASDPVGFFTVAKLVGLLVPTISALLVVHGLVMRGIINQIVDEKMQTIAVARIEYDVRRAEMERALARLESTDIKVGATLQEIDGRLRNLEDEAKLTRERLNQVRARLGMKNGE